MLEQLKEKKAKEQLEKLSLANQKKQSLKE